jgi:hypothetical protein
MKSVPFETLSLLIRLLPVPNQPPSPLIHKGDVQSPIDPGAAAAEDGVPSFLLPARPGRGGGCSVEQSVGDRGMDTSGVERDCQRYFWKRGTGDLHLALRGRAGQVVGRC